MGLLSLRELIHKVKPVSVSPVIEDTLETCSTLSMATLFVAPGRDSPGIALTRFRPVPFS